MWKIKFLSNFPLGVLFGAISALVLAFFLDAEVRSTTELMMPYLVPSAAALISATLAISGVLANIENQRSLQDESYRRKFRANVSALHLMLSESLSCIETAINQLSKRLIEGNENDSLKSWPDTHFEGFSPEALNCFHTLVELSPDEDAEAHFNEILQLHQIAVARWKHYQKKKKDPNFLVGSHNLKSEILLLSFLGVLLARTLDLARKRRPRIERHVSKDDVRSTLSSAIFSEHCFDAVLSNFGPGDFQSVIKAHRDR